MGRKRKQPPLTVVSAVYSGAPDLLKQAAAYKTLAGVAIRMLRAKTDEKISPEEDPGAARFGQAWQETNPCARASGAPENSSADAREPFVYRVPIDAV